MNRDDLVGVWIHSHEESRDGAQVYRPVAYPFPPSRGRTSFTLRADGSARTGQPGPDDRGTTADGSWRLDGTVLALRGPEGTARYEVLAADGQHLELRPA
ncbi:hypothetical protein RCH16_003600 [Cryobacterium sp. MP_M5]|uniref:hypothetical protein n=1 Tax=unclassified Cryobacterium TaxID=2649013 RepID=UPI0018C9A9DF|nr:MULTISPECIES: hypothetical protein [unclassified Cryobacterium]MBG6058970.1 hypothetical protein [Cryobacterium sp. MP_M3]MEC5178561.1 hypothetical protein [Cryobacterium sp. MP_M5]